MSFQKQNQPTLYHAEMKNASVCGGFLPEIKPYGQFRPNVLTLQQKLYIINNVYAHALWSE
jgi:hypothetical protein